jgi:hypothetical protein
MPASIPVCPSRGFCTAECPIRSTCTKTRIPLLIPAIVIHYRTGRIYPDEYINELAQIKQEKVDLAGHRGVPDSLRDYRSNVKIGAI